MVAAAVYFSVVCSSRFWTLLLESESQGPVRSTVTFLGTIVALSGAHILLLLPFSSRWTVKPSLLLLFTANAFTVHFMDRYGVYVDTSMVQNVLQTDSAEALELMTWRLTPHLLVYTVIPALLLLGTRLVRVPFATAARRKALLLVCGCAALGIGLLVCSKSYTSLSRNNPKARYLIVPANYIVSVARIGLSAGRDLSTERAPVGTDAVLGDAWKGDSRPVVFVVVVGESARASCFSLNGYSRDTNPRLAGVPGLVNFPQVSACGTSTANALPCMFSPFARSDPEHRRARRYESLLDVVERSGLEVSWVDNNSGCKGVCDGAETVSVEESSSSDLCSDGTCFDEILLAELERKLDGGKSALVVLHQKGSHGPAYHRRYPKTFEEFTPACTSDDFSSCTREEIRNAYDNSILYTDHVLAEVIARLDLASDRYDTAMLYVSDHGESTGEGGIYLHGLPYAIAPETQTRVPMVLWVSDPFARRFSVNREGIARAAATSSYSHDHLFHSVLGALDVRTSVYDPRLDIFAAGRFAPALPPPATAEPGS